MTDLETNLGNVTALQSDTNLAPLAFMARSEFFFAAQGTLNDADLVEKIVKKAATSFYWGMRILSPERRQAMFALYAFCREVDDIADEYGSDTEKAHALSGWKTEIDLLYRPDSHARSFRTAIGRQLFLAHQRFNLARADFFSVIDGMAMDAIVIQAPDWDQFDLYCDRVASAVGRLSVKIFGTPENLASDLAYHQGRALQITNILRDLREDAARNRLYLPRNLLLQADIEATTPEQVLAHPHLPKVVAQLGEIAAHHYQKTDHILTQCSGKSARPSRIMAAIYQNNFRQLQKRGWGAILDPLTISKWHKLFLALKAAYF